jgi:hypothetical protein
VEEVLLDMDPASFERMYIISSREGKYQSLWPFSTKAEQFRAAVAIFAVLADC